MSSMPGGVNNRKQRRSKKLSSLFEAVRRRIECIGDHFWEYMQAYPAPYHYRKRTPSGHFIGHMPGKMLSGDNTEKSGFTAPGRMIFEKLNDFEGPEVYNPGMWSLYFTVATLQKNGGGLPGVMVKRGLRQALGRYNCGREYQARFGDEILPGMPGDSPEAHQRVQELACLRKRQGPSSYFITLTLRMPKFPATCDCYSKILEERVAAAPHLPYLSRAWRRALNKLFEWLASGEERPLGIVSPYCRRPEYQAGQGKKAKRDLEHAHGLLWTLDRINDPDPEVRAKARADLSRRVTADVVEVLRQYIAVELPNPFAWAAEAQEIQNHSHSYSCLTNGQCRHGYPEPALSWASFIEINVTVPESVEEVLEAMGVAERDGSTSELKLCPELQGGKNLPARSAASMYMSTSQPRVFTETDGSHHNVQHNDATQFENAYIVNYSAREDERSLVRITPKDKDKARLEFVDRNIRKRLAKEEGKKGKDEYHKTRESLPEPELVSLLHQQPSTYCAEVTDRERGLLRPIEFQHFSTALPSERYVVMKKRRPDQAEEGETGPLFGGPTSAEALAQHMETLSADWQASIGQLRTYIRWLYSDKCPENVGKYNLGPPSLCAKLLPFWVFMECALRTGVQLTKAKKHMHPLEAAGVPRGLLTEKVGFLGLRGERWKLRPAFFAHPDYAGFAEKVFVDKMERPRLLQNIRDALAGRKRATAEICAYVDWDAPQCLGVTRNVSPAQHLRWLVHRVLMSETPFDDEVELFEKGVQVAARTAKRKGQAILSGDVVCMLRRSLMDDLRYWSIGYRKMWKVVAEANIALKELVDDTWCSENEHRFYLPALEEDLDEEHAVKYERLIETIEKRHHNVLVGIRAHNAVARARGAPASDDGHLVRGCEEVHSFNQTEES